MTEEQEQLKVDSVDQAADDVTDEFSEVGEQEQAEHTDATEEKEGLSDEDILAKKLKEVKKAKSSGDNAGDFKESPLGNNFSINFNSHIEELSTEFATAYEARYSKSSAANDSAVYALVFEQSFPLRQDIIKLMQYKNIDDLNFPRLLDHGLITMPKSHSERFVVIMDRPVGQSLRTLFANDPPADKFFINNIIVPLSNTIHKLSERDLVHGSINIDNIYYDMEKNKIFIGECLSGPCGHNQSPVFETIGRASSHKCGKGDKDITADYFALGMVALFLGAGKIPMENEDEDEIMKYRVFKNSFLTFVQNIKLSTPMMDLLRGLLCDKDEKRWGGLQIDNWLRNKTSQISTTPVKEAMRGFIFNDQEYFNCRSLIWAIYNNMDKAKTDLKTSELSRWMTNSLLNIEMANQYESLSFHSRSAEKLVLNDSDIIRILAVIDMSGPLRHPGFVIDIYGIGSLLAYAFAKGNRAVVQNIADMFSTGFIEFWCDLGNLDERATEDPRHNKLLWEHKKIVKYLRNSKMGFGIERVLYETNPHLPCQSSILQGHYVTTMQEILLALDDIAKHTKGYENNDPVDRHIAAFIASRLDLRDDIFSKASTEHEMLNSPQIIMLHFLAEAQMRSRTKNLVSLSGWAVKRLQEPLQKLHGKTIKKEMLKNLKQVAKSGDLSKVLNTVSDVSYIKKDSFEFKEAARYYKELGERIDYLSKQENTEGLAYRHGLKVAAAIGMGVCIMTFLYFLVDMAHVGN